MIDQRTLDHPLHPRPVWLDKSRFGVAVREVDLLAAVLAYQGRPLVGALPAAHNQNAFVPVELEIDRVARVCIRTRRQPLENVRRIVLEEGEAESEEDAVGEQ